METLKKYLKIWLKLTAVASQIAFSSRIGAMVFVLAKIFRFSFFLLFLTFLASKTKIIAGYSFWEVILFFATFNLIDTFTQFFLREVYRFRMYVVSGYFDYILIRPFSALLRSLFGGSDILDLPILFMSLIFIIFSITKIGDVSLFGILFYILLVLNAFIIAVSFHILVLSIGILTTEVDNTIMLYRDIITMGRLPVDIYKEPLSWVLTFIVPVGIMVTFPAKLLIGVLSPVFVLIAFTIGLILLILSYELWRVSVKNYVSASS